jgi:transcriptional regulator with XRE-family HTH domain
MPAANRFVEALKRSVRARGLTYAELAQRLRLSEASVKRMFSRGSFTLARIEEVLAAVDLDLYDVARMTRGGGNGPAQLTHEQELGLARDERLLAVFWLLLNGWTFDEILEAFTIARTELTSAFARLEKLKLIEWGPRERARLLVQRDFVWRSGGPAKKAYARWRSSSPVASTGRSTWSASSRGNSPRNRRRRSSASSSSSSPSSTSAPKPTRRCRRAAASRSRCSPAAVPGSSRR